MVEEVKMEKEIIETQISDFAQFIDVLEAISKYETIEEVRADIVIRKKLLKESIVQMKKNVEN